MKIVNVDDKYIIYNDSLKTYDKLPSQVYQVCFNKMTGFFLEKYNDIEIKEKIYGNQSTKSDKVFTTFEKVNRNLGVILSGSKGIGKSLTAKLIAAESINRGIPVVLVTQYIPGIADYIESIDQEITVLFNEFDKTFKEFDDHNPQNEMLTLFDGMSQGKKLFIITCNEIRNLNEFLVNRPGRFHYHFRFDFPTPEEITEYLQDKLEEKYWDEISKVICFSSKVNLNYDCLRSIAFELSMGYSFEEAIKDLNILNTKVEKYKVTIYFEDGSIVSDQTSLDLFGNNEISSTFYDNNKNEFDIKFNTEDIYFNLDVGSNVIDGKNVATHARSWTYNLDEPIEKEMYEKYSSNKIKIKQVVFNLISEQKSFHYAL